MRSVRLVRHLPVDTALQGICYGSSDVPLSPAALDMTAELVELLASEGPVDHLYHSGLLRTAGLASALADRLQTVAIVDMRLRERCFGTWELRRWDDIHAETGDAMLGMTNAPATWRPPGGETTFELRDRVCEWYAQLPASGTCVAITHGGPIAALCGTLAGLPPSDWLPLIPRCGAIVRVQ